MLYTIKWQDQLQSNKQVADIRKRHCENVIFCHVASFKECELSARGIIPFSECKKKEREKKKKEI